MAELTQREHIIAVIPTGDESRLVFASSTEAVEKPIVLRQESFSSHVGWFVQSTIAMTRVEMVALRSAMGGAGVCNQTRLRAEARQASEPQKILSFRDAQSRKATSA